MKMLKKLLLFSFAVCTFSACATLEIALNQVETTSPASTATGQASGFPASVSTGSDELITVPSPTVEQVPLQAAAPDLSRLPPIFDDFHIQPGRELTLSPENELPPGAIFSDSACHVRFSYPLEWEVSTIVIPEADTECAFGVRPPGWLDFIDSSQTVEDPYTIRLSLFRKSFIDVAADSGFVQEHGQPGIMGRQAITLQAYLMQMEDRWVLYGESFYGLLDKNGGYAGLGIFNSAVIHQDSTHAATLYSLYSGNRQYWPAYQMILTSLQSIPATGIVDH
jgi:hypothetical protein